ncbi:penicillin-binding protein 2 [Nitratifractor sp.]
MRLKIILLIFALFWGVLIVRLYHISIKSNFYYEKLAKENIERKSYLKPVRGEILDAKGNYLAVNRIGFSLSLAPHLSIKKGQLKQAIETLREYFPDLNATVMERVYRRHSSPYNHRFIKVIEFVPYDQMMRYYAQLSMLPTVKIEAETKRYYPYGRYAAHVVGYVGRSNRKENAADPVTAKVGRTGKSGLELYYNRLLEGELGYVISKVDARNRELKVLDRKEPVSNRSLKIHLDMDLQKYIYDLLGKKPAVVIVMRPSGEVLAAVSNPSFDPNLFVGGISVKDWKALQNNLGHPFTNKFINAVYPPGSVIKMGVALAASREGKGILDEHEYCKGYITIDKSKHKFRCWSRWGHGDVDLRKSIRESCDVYYYNKSLKIGIDKIAKTLRQIGLGVRTGIDLPREYRGIIPDKAWKRKRYHQPWYKGETVIAAIGQGYDNITPMQIARYTAFLATGKLPTPTLAAEIDGKKVKPRRVKIPFNPYHMSVIRQGMIDVCNDRRGTAYKTMNQKKTGLPFLIAAKTGTAQVVSIPQDVKKRVKEEDLAYFKKSHAWITTYAPAKKPEYIITVLVEHGGHGGSAAGPIAAQIYRWLYLHGYIRGYPPPKPSAEQNATSDKKPQETPALRMDQSGTAKQNVP